MVLHRILETMIFYLRGDKDVVDVQLDVLNGLGSINVGARSQCGGVGGVSVVLGQKNTGGCTLTSHKLFRAVLTYFNSALLHYYN